MSSKTVVAALIAVTAFTAVGRAQVPAPGDTPGAVSKPAPEYVVGAHDILAVTVFNQPDFSGRFEIGADGALTFPLVGPVKVAGLTTRAVERALFSKLAPAFLRNPQISVTVEAYRSQQFFVIGQVNTPGTFFLSGPLTVIQALARAGSTKADASDEVLVIRSRAGRRSGPLRPEQVDQNDVRPVDLGNLASGDFDDDILVEDGYTIYVPKAEMVFVMGEVRNPGQYRYSKSITVQQYLSLAGGPTERGATNRVTIKRVVNGKSQPRKVSLDEKVTPNDTILVPEKFF